MFAFQRLPRGGGGEAGMISDSRVNIMWDDEEWQCFYLDESFGDKFSCPSQKKCPNIVLIQRWERIGQEHERQLLRDEGSSRLRWQHFSVQNFPAGHPSLSRIGLANARSGQPACSPPWAAGPDAPSPDSHTPTCTHRLMDEQGGFIFVLAQKLRNKGDFLCFLQLTLVPPLSPGHVLFLTCAVTIPCVVLSWHMNEGQGIVFYFSFMHWNCTMLSRE